MDQDLRRLERAAKQGGPADMAAWLSALCRIGQHHGVFASSVGATWSAHGYLIAQPVCATCRAPLAPGAHLAAWRRGGQEGAKDCATEEGRTARVQRDTSTLRIVLEGRQTGRTSRMLGEALTHALRIVRRMSPEVRIVALFKTTMAADYAWGMLRMDVPDRMGARTSPLPVEVWTKAVDLVQCRVANASLRAYLAGGRCAIYQDHSVGAASEWLREFPNGTVVSPLLDDDGRYVGLGAGWHPPNPANMHGAADEFGGSDYA